MFIVSEWVNHLCFFLFSVEIPLQHSNNNDDEKTELNYNQWKHSLSLGIFDTASTNEIIIFPGVIPLVHVINWTFIGPITNRNTSVVSVITYFEGMRSVWMFVYFKNESRSVGGVLNNAVLTLVVVKGSVEIVSIDTFSTCHSQSINEVQHCGVMSWVKSPLNSLFIFCNIPKILDSFVKKTSGSCSELVFSVKQF